eukprot:Em0018g1022a
MLLLQGGAHFVEHLTTFPQKWLKIDDTMRRLICGVLACFAMSFWWEKPPFEAPTSEETHKRISKVDLQFPSHVSPGARDLISKLLKHDPQKRLPLSEVLKHTWILENADKLPQPSTCPQPEPSAA